MKTFDSNQPCVFFSVIMKEYEKTISRLVAEKSQEKAAFDEKHVDLVKERDQAQQHLNNMEIAFSDIHTYVINVVSFGLPMFDLYCVIRRNK